MSFIHWPGVVVSVFVIVVVLQICWVLLGARSVRRR